MHLNGMQKPAMKNFFLRQQSWVADVEARAAGRRDEITKRRAVKTAEKVVLTRQSEIQSGGLGTRVKLDAAKTSH